MSTEKKEEADKDEYDRFLDEIKKKIPDTDELYDSVLTLATVRPSSIKDADPNAILIEAQELDKRERIGDAFHKFRRAALSAFYNKSENMQKIWNAYAEFLGRNEGLAHFHSKDLEAYERVKKREDIMQILINTYGEFIRAPVEISKKKS